MGAQFSVSSHTTFFDGYLDATGRHYSGADRLCAMSASIMPAPWLERLTLVSATPVEDMVGSFENDISRFLNTSPRTPLLFYLIEYFGWFKEYSATCSCEKVRLTGRGLSGGHVAYRLLIDQSQEVVFLGYWQARNAGGG